MAGTAFWERVMWAALVVMLAAGVVTVATGGTATDVVGIGCMALITAIIIGAVRAARHKPRDGR